MPWGKGFSLHSHFNSLAGAGSKISGEHKELVENTFGMLLFTASVGRFWFKKRRIGKIELNIGDKELICKGGRIYLCTREIGKR